MTRTLIKRRRREVHRRDSYAPTGPYLLIYKQTRPTSRRSVPLLLSRRFANDRTRSDDFFKYQLVWKSEKQLNVDDFSNFPSVSFRERTTEEKFCSKEPGKTNGVGVFFGIKYLNGHSRRVRPKTYGLE